MQSKSAELQDQINEIDQLIQGGASDAQLNLWEMRKGELIKDRDAALTEETTTEKIGYILDNMTVEGLTIAEIITNDNEYKLVRQGVQEAFALQAGSYEHALRGVKDAAEIDIKNLSDRVTLAEQLNAQLQKDNQSLETTNFQLTLDNESLDEKVRKGADQNHELTQQVEQQKQHISDLQTQIAIGVRGALNVVDIPQDTSKMAADIIARKVRITNVELKDKHGIDQRIKTAEIVLTGESIEYETIYEKRYIILNSMEAEQYRADEANRKAELELQNAVIPTIEQEIDPVLEVEAPKEEIPFHESNQVDADTSEEVTEGDRNGSSSTVVETASEVITLESLKNEVDAIKTYLGLVA